MLSKIVMRHPSLPVVLVPALLLGCVLVAPDPTTGDDPETGETAETGNAVTSTTGPATESGLSEGSTSTSTDSTTASTGTTGTTDPGTTTSSDASGGAPAQCDEDDQWEPNGVPEAATAMTLNGNGVELSAFLCSEDSDWYHIPVSSIKFDGGYHLIIDARLPDLPCGEFCQLSSLPEAPENSIHVDLHDAATLELLASGEGTKGRAQLWSFGEVSSPDVLVHVRGLSPAATYSYELHVEMNSGGEDECEC